MSIATIVKRLDKAECEMISREAAGWSSSRASANSIKVRTMGLSPESTWVLRRCERRLLGQRSSKHGRNWDSRQPWSGGRA